MRAGLVGILFFAGLLALGHYWGGPAFCRGTLSIPGLDPRQLCNADIALNRSGSMLLYFASIAAAMFFGLIAAALPSRRKSGEKKEEKPETFEEIIAKQEGDQAKAVAAASVAAATATAVAAAPAAEAPAANAAAPAESSTPEDAAKDKKDSAAEPAKAEAAEAVATESKLADPAKSESKSDSEAEAAVNAAILAATGTSAGETPAEIKKPEDAIAESATAKAEDKKPEAEKSGEAKAGDAKSGEEEPKAEPVPASVVTSDEPKPEPIVVKAADQQTATADSKPADDKLADEKPADTKPTPEQVLEAAVADALALGMNEEKAESEKPLPKADPEAMLAEAKAAVDRGASGDPQTLATAEAISAGLAANQNGARRPFEGTNEELVERFRELRRHEGINSIAQAQRLLDESTLGALNKGIDPKQHLSDVAHLVLVEDPDLKSSVVRGVVVHIAARLKELGVVQKDSRRTGTAA